MFFFYYHLLHCIRYLPRAAKEAEVSHIHTKWFLHLKISGTFDATAISPEVIHLIFNARAYAAICKYVRRPVSITVISPVQKAPLYSFILQTNVYHI